MAVDLKDLVIKRWKTKWTAKRKVDGVWVTYSVSTRICNSVQDFIRFIEERKPFDGGKPCTCDVEWTLSKHE